MHLRRACVALWLVCAACDQPSEAPKVAAPATSAPSDLSTDDAKTLYALGVFHGKSLAALKLTPEELRSVQEGFSDAAQGKRLQVDLNTYGPKAQNILMARASAAKLAASAAQPAKDAPLAEKISSEPGAVKLPSGAVVKTTRPGSGPSPGIADRVRVRYEGRLLDGTVIDSSDKRGDGARFAMVSVMPCWNEALQRMKVGEVASLLCPPSTAFGDSGREPKVPGGATLAFTVELLEINPKEAPIVTRGPKR